MGTIIGVATCECTKNADKKSDADERESEPKMAAMQRELAACACVKDAGDDYSDDRLTHLSPCSPCIGRRELRARQKGASN